MLHKRISLCLAALLLLMVPLAAFAAPMDYGRTGSITVTLGGRNPMEGAVLEVYYVATVSQNSAGNLNYGYTNDFKNCGIPLEDPDLAARLDAYVPESGITPLTCTTDRQGKAVIQDLPLGLYFIRQQGTVSGFAPIPSFLITVPMKDGDSLVYDVDASPKTQTESFTTVVIKKVWNTGGTGRLPESVTVQLLCHGKCVETVVLNRGNQWTAVLEDLPESDGYTVQEYPVPRGYVATYSRWGNFFTVTNTPALAQTGQLVWPIPLLAVSGLILLALGALLLRKSGKRHG